jgi:hypothetical protein
MIKRDATTAHAMPSDAGASRFYAAAHHARSLTARCAVNRADAADVVAQKA